jgi:hypothetical protein
MATLTPIVSSQPPNFGMAETFSWIGVDNNQNRPLFARAAYITNLSDLSISLSASDLSIGSVELKDTASNVGANVFASAGGKNALAVHNTNNIGQFGFVFSSDTTAVYGNFTTLHVLSACRFTSLTATNSTINNLANFELPHNFIFSGPITGYKLAYGAVIAYKG